MRHDAESAPLTFEEWVRKWRIRPGMNDRNASVRAYLEKLARRPASRGAADTVESSNEEPADSQVSAARIVALQDEELYSGFDGSVGRGWLPLLDRLAHDLVELGWDRDLHQVKEKYGTLRFYVGTSSPAIDARIDQAEAESATTCEGCGAPGRLRELRWIRTLCDHCVRTAR